MAEGSSGTYTVALATQPSATVTVAISGAGDGVSVDKSSLTFTGADWSTARTVTVSAGEDDNTVSETVTLTHTPSGGDYGSVSAATVRVTTTDNDTAALVLSESALAVTEGGTGTYTVRLATQPSATVTVAVTGEGSGVSVDKSSLTFTGADWSAARTVTVSAGEDDNAGAETVDLVHTPSGGDYGSVSTATVRVTTTDNDTRALVLSRSTLPVTEGGTGTYTVRLATQPSATVTVAISGAGDGVSVDKSSLTFTGADWSTARTVTVSAGEDANTVSESVTLTHTPSGGDYGSVPTKTVVVTTTDNDTANLEPSFADATIADQAYTQGTSIGTLSLPEATGGDGTLTYTLEGSGGAALPAGLTFNATARTLAGTPSAVQAATTYTYTATDADEGMPDVATLTFTIEVTALVGTTKTTTVSGVEVRNALDTGSLRVSVDGSKLRVTVEGGDNDGAWVVLPAGARVVVDEVPANSPSRSTTPPGYEARGPGDALLDVAVTGLGVGEAAELCVPFGGAGKAALFRWNESAVPPSWERVGDATTSRPVCGTKSGSFSPFAVFAAMDPVGAPALVLSQSSLPVAEGGTGTYTVRLATQPAGTVTVAVTGAGGGVSVDKSSLTFTGADWSTAQTVAVTAGEDDNTRVESVGLVHTASGGGYAGAPVATVWVTTIDNDTEEPTATITAGTSPVTEGTDAEFTVTLSSAAPAGGLTVHLSVSEAAGSDYVASADEGAKTLVFAEGDTSGIYSVATVDDADEEPDGSVTVTLSSAAPAAGYNLGAPLSASVTVRDDDGADVEPSFGDRGVANQSYTQNTPIAALTLPAATGGNGTLRYGLSPSAPAGLTFDAATRRLTGTPTGTQDATTYTYTVTDADGDTATLDFTIAIEETGNIEVPDDLPAELRRVPRNVAVSATGVVTWDLDTDTEADPRTSYWVEWIWDEQAPSRMHRESPYFGKAELEEYQCSGGKCEVRIDEFHAGRHYLVYVSTWARWEKRLPAVAVRHTPAPGEALDLTGLPKDVAITGAGLVTWGEASVPVEYYSVAWASGDSRLERSRSRGARGRDYRIVEVDTCADRRCRFQIPRFDAERHWVAEVNSYEREQAAREPVRARYAPGATRVTVGAGPAVDEGTAASFTVTLSEAAPAGGLTLAYRVSEDRDFVAASDEGAKTLAIPAGATSATIRVPTVGDGRDGPDGAVTVTLGDGVGYVLGDPSSATVAVRDADAAGLDTFTIYHDPGGGAEAVSRYGTAVALLDAGYWRYRVRTVSGTGEVERLAGVSDVVLPRFFLGDPEDAGWGPAQASVNNGGLEWLRAQIGQAPPPPAEPLPEPGSELRKGPIITVYRDPDPAGEAVGRYETAVKLFDAAERRYEVRTVTDDQQVDRLAGVEDSVMPRFFLGDPEETGWGPSEPKVNNGGLGWLRGELAPQLPGVSVADARVREAPGAVLVFAVTLDRAPRWVPVSVDYGTFPWTADRGVDYTALSGTLTFAPGETAKTVRVRVLDDAHDEGEETMLLLLSNPSGLRIVDREGRGTIANTDAMPKAWLARFGRTVAEQVVSAAEDRFGSPRQAGVEGQIAGRTVGGGGAESELAGAHADALLEWLEEKDGLGRFETEDETFTAGEALRGASFALTQGSDEGGFVTVWGRSAVSRFDGGADGLSLDGEVASAMAGADWSRGRATAGVMVSHSRGEGGYGGSSGGGGEVESTLSGLYPYGRWEVSERVSVWGVAGYGQGVLVLEPEGAEREGTGPEGTEREGAGPEGTGPEGAGPEGAARLETDTALVMAALGVRGLIVTPSAERGAELAVKADALAVRMSSARVDGLAAARAGVTRLRVGLEGSWSGVEAGGGALRPTLEVGLRHDGGDAETGFGADIGAGLAWSDPALGLEAEVSARGLLTHADGGFRERGIAGSLTWDPSPSSERGLRLELRQAVGASSTGGMDALLARDTMAGLAVAEEGGPEAQPQRFEARLGYGLPAFGGRFTMTPEVGVGVSESGADYTFGWRLATERSGGMSFEFGVEATRRESTGAEPDHGVGFKLNIRW